LHSGGAESCLPISQNLPGLAVGVYGCAFVMAKACRIIEKYKKSGKAFSIGNAIISPHQEA
jgi:hypothetical protein